MTEYSSANLNSVTHTYVRLKLENADLIDAYSKLEEKYAPYQENIDRLEDENKLLRSQTAMAQAEAKRLSEQYARLLGHQNQKQKIQHVKNLKDENAALKQVCVCVCVLSLFVYVPYFVGERIPPTP